MGLSKIYPLPYFRFCSLLWGMYESGDAETLEIWEEYGFIGVRDFAKVSQILDFDLLFSEHIYDGERSRQEIIKLDEMLIALKQHLKAFRLNEP